MANQTLTGCIDFETGLAKFDQGDCEYTGCLVTGGIHAGQVAVTIDTDSCDDIYYGCVVFPSGTFEVVVPDDCCSGDNCSTCTGITPKNLTFEFDGWAFVECLNDTSPPNRIHSVDNDFSSVINGTHVLTQDPLSPCIWSKEIAFPFTVTFWSDPDCTGSNPLGPIVFTTFPITVTRFANVLFLSIGAGWALRGQTTLCPTTECHCPGASFTDFDERSHLVGGTIAWCQGSWPSGCP